MPYRLITGLDEPALAGLPTTPEPPPELTAELAGLLAARAGTHPDEPALLAARGGRTRTWADLSAAAAHWSGRARSQQAMRQRPVALAVADPIDFAAAFLGLLAAGATVAPLDPHAPLPGLEADLIEVGAPAGVALLVTDRDLPAGFQPQTPRAPVPADGAASAEPRTAATGIPRSGRVLLRSSGTTGNRKHILLAERQLLHTARAVARHHRLLPADRGLCPLPLFHVNAEVVGLLTTVVAGASLVVDDRFHRTDFWQLVDDHRVTWINAVPGVLALLADDKPTPSPHRVRFVRSASAPLPTAVLARFELTCGLSVLETYGMTEAASQITANPLDGPRKPGSVGLPVDTELRVVDRDGQPCAPLAIGSVEIRGDGVVAGPLPGGWLVTGDLGYLDADGYLFLTGRSGEVINRGGEKVFPRPIEEELLRDAAVLDAAVVAQPHPVLGSVPVAFVVSRTDDAGALAARLRRRCTDTLTKPRRPAALHVVRSLPAGPTGKTSRRLVREQQDELAARSVGRA